MLLKWGTQRRCISVATDHRSRSRDLVYESKDDDACGFCGRRLRRPSGVVNALSTTVQSPPNAARAFSTPRQNPQAARTRLDDVLPPAAERPTVRAAEDSPNLARADRRRSAEAAASRPAADTDARAPGASPPAAEGPTARAAEDSLDLARADRRRIQAGLTASGLEPGPADGMFGAGTRSAIRDWQAGRGLPATGYLNAAEAEELIALGRGSGEGRRAEARRPSAVVEDSGGSLAVRAEPASRIELDGAAEFPTARAAEDSPNRLLRRSFSCSQVSPPNPLFRAVKRGNVEIVTILADLCPEHLDTVHEQAFRLHETPLSLAVKAQAVGMVRVLLEAGADPNTITPPNAFSLHETPLSLAVKDQAVEMVRVLLEAGADPNTITPQNAFGCGSSSLAAQSVSPAAARQEAIGSVKAW